MNSHFLLEDKIASQNKLKGKCIWVGRKRDFFSFHSSLIPIERSKQSWEDFRYEDFMRIRARNIFFQYKKREHERRHRYRAVGTKSFQLQKQFEDMHRCEICQGIFETVDLFWGITLCRKCYFTPEYINFIMANRFGDLVSSTLVSRPPLPGCLSSPYLPPDRLQIIREMKPGFKPNEYILNEIGDSITDPKQLDALKVRRKNCFNLLDQGEDQNPQDSTVEALQNHLRQTHPSSPSQTTSYLEKKTDSLVENRNLPMQAERKRRRLNPPKPISSGTVELKPSETREKDRVQTSLISYFVKPSSKIGGEQSPLTTSTPLEMENTSPTEPACDPEENGIFYEALYGEDQLPDQDSLSPTQDIVEELGGEWDFSELQLSAQTPSSEYWLEDFPDMLDLE